MSPECVSLRLLKAKRLTQVLSCAGGCSGGLDQQIPGLTSDSPSSVGSSYILWCSFPLQGTTPALLGGTAMFCLLCSPAVSQTLGEQERSGQEHPYQKQVKSFCIFLHIKPSYIHQAMHCQELFFLKCCVLSVCNRRLHIQCFC